MNKYCSKYLKYKKKYLNIIRNNIICNNIIEKKNIKGGSIDNSNLGHINIINNNVILYAIGDIHGDFELLKYILTKLLNVATYNSNNDTFTWKKDSKNIYLIFNGDLVDRGGRNEKVVDIEKSDIKIIENLIYLKEQAQSINSDILLMCGNHELMIFNQDFRYSTLDKDQKKYIKKGSTFSKLYADNVLGLLRINNIIFAHGGVCKEMFEPSTYNVDFKNVDIFNYINNLIRKWLYNKSLSIQEQKNMNILLFGDSASPMWCRTFGYKKENDITCGNEIDEDVFQNLNNVIPEEYQKQKRMIIAHTHQTDGINQTCNGKVWRIDTGMSRAFDKHIEDKSKDTLKRLKEKYKNGNSRKIQVLKISMNNNNLFTNFKIIDSQFRTYDLIKNTESLDKCIQYPKLKYCKK